MNEHQPEHVSSARPTQPLPGSDSRDDLTWDIPGRGLTHQLLGTTPQQSIHAIDTHRNTCYDTLRELAATQRGDILAAIAANTTTPADLLEELAHPDQNPDVLSYIASNPATSSHVITRLSHHTDAYVRWGTADNPRTPPDILVRLAHDSDQLVRARVASNPNTPTGTIKELSSDPCIEVADNADTNGRVHCLRRYADSLPEPEHGHAQLLIDNGFPGWPEQLATILTSQRHISTPTVAGRTVRPAASAQPAHSGHSHQS